MFKFPLDAVDTIYEDDKYNFEMMNDETLLSTMAEGRTIKNRRHAYSTYHIRYKNMIQTMSDMQTELEYLRSITGITNVVKSIINIYLIRVIHDTYIIFNENDNMCTVHSVVDKAYNRSELRVLVEAVSMYGPNCKYYIDSNYLNTNVKVNIIKWKQNNYTTQDGDKVKNEDLITKLDELRIDMHNIFQTRDAHVPIVNHIRQTYEKMYNITPKSIVLDRGETMRLQM